MKKSAKIRVDFMISKETLKRLDDYRLKERPELSRSEIIENIIRRKLDSNDHANKLGEKLYR